MFPEYIYIYSMTQIGNSGTAIKLFLTLQIEILLLQGVKHNVTESASSGLLNLEVLHAAM